MKRIKLIIIHWLDYYLDCKILQHRWHWFCNWVTLSSWWGDRKCTCNRCQEMRALLLEE